MKIKKKLLLGSCGIFFVSMQVILNASEFNISSYHEDQKGLSRRLMDFLEATPQGKKSPSESLVLVTPFLEPHVVHRDKIKNLLDSQATSNLPRVPFICHIPDLSYGLPVGPIVSSSLFHSFLTAEAGILPGIFVLMRENQGIGQGVRNRLIFVQGCTQRSIKDEDRWDTWISSGCSSRQIGALILSSLLTYGAGGDISSFLLGQDAEKRQTLYDRGRGILPSAIYHDGTTKKHFLESQNPLYSMADVMGQPIDPILKERIQKTNGPFFLLNWLNALKKEGEASEIFLKEQGVPLALLLESGLPIALSKFSTKTLLSRFNRLQESVARRTCYDEILKDCEPLLYTFYQKLRLSEISYLSKMEIGNFKSLESLLPLNKTLDNGEKIFEVLERERHPKVGLCLTQSLDNSIKDIWESISFTENDALLLDFCARSFGANVLKSLTHFSPILLNTFLKITQEKETINFLLLSGANLNDQDVHGQSVVHYRLDEMIIPTDERERDLLYHMVEKGASLSLVDRVGHSILDLALIKELDSTFSSLLQAHQKNFPGRLAKCDTNIFLKAQSRWEQKGKPDDELKTGLDIIKKIHPAKAWAVAVQDIFPIPSKLLYSYEELRALATELLTDEDDRDSIYMLIDRQRPLNVIQEKMERFLGYSLLDSDGSEKRLEVKGPFLGNRFLSLEAENQLWNEDGQVRRHNQYGRRSVAKVSVGESTLYFKHLPELPGFEYAIHRLHEKIMGNSTPPNELVRIKNQPFLVSLGIEGENLSDVLKNKDTLKLTQLEPNRLSSLILMAFLTNPEDSKADNFILTPSVMPNFYDLVSVDNDHALMPTVTRQNEDPRSKKTLQVKSILYCLDQMENAIPETVRTLFLSFNPHDLLESWLVELNNLTKSYDRLFSNDEARELLLQDCVTCIPFRAQMITQIYDKMVRLQTLLSIKTDKLLTHFSILETLEPLLAKRYKKGFIDSRLVRDRFASINGAFYDIDGSGHYVSTTRSSMLLTGIGIPVQESLIQTVRRGHDLSIYSALEELKVIRLEKEASFLKGNKGMLHFQQLRSENAQSLFLKKYDFQYHTPSEQQAFLTLLNDRDMRYLTLINNGSLTPDALQAIGVGNLTSLHLQYTEDRLAHDSLDDNFIQTLHQFNHGLTTLFLEGFSALWNMSLNFPNLKSVTLKNCSNLQEVQSTAPHLRHMRIQYCKIFNKINHRHPTLKTLDVSHNESLTDKILDDFLEIQTNLKTVVVAGSPHISFSDIREANHRYPIKLLENAVHRQLKSIILFILECKSLFLPLDFYDRRLSNSGILAIVEALKLLPEPPLLTLEWGANNLDDRAVVPFLEACKNHPQLKHIMHLDLSCNQLNSKGIIALSNFVSRDSCLRNLNLRFTFAQAGFDNKMDILRNMRNITGPVHNYEDMVSACNRIDSAFANPKQNDVFNPLAKSFKNNTSLTEIDLSMNSRVINVDSVKILQKSLRNHPTLKKLNISCNNLGVAASYYGGKILKYTKSLRELNLASNGIPPEGALFLSRCLSQNTSLESLVLGNNKIKDEGIFNLSKNYLSQPSAFLKALDISANKISQEGAKIIAYALGKNNVLRTIDISENNIAQKGAEYLHGALKNNTVLTKLKIGNSYDIDDFDDDDSLAFFVGGPKKFDNDYYGKILQAIKSFIYRNRSLEKEEEKNIPQKSEKTLKAHMGNVSFDLEDTVNSEQTDFLRALKLDRFSLINRLMDSRAYLVYWKEFSSEIEKSFLTGKLDATIVDKIKESKKVKKEGNNKNLEDYITAHVIRNDLIIRRYIISVLGGEEEFQHQTAPHVLTAIAHMQEISYAIWKKDKDLSDNLILVDKCITRPPLRHFLYCIDKEKEVEFYKDLDEKQQSGLGVIAYLSDQPREVLEDLDFLAHDALIISQGCDLNAPLLFPMNVLNDLTPALQQLISRLTTDTKDLIVPPGRLSKGEVHSLLNCLSTTPHTLNRLIIPACELDDGIIPALKTFLTKSPSLKFLSLAGNNLNVFAIKKIKEILQTHKTLTHLVLSNNHGARPELERDIQDLLSRNRALTLFPTIQQNKNSHLDISRIGAPGIRLLLDQLGRAPFITHLNLSFVPLSEKRTLDVLIQFLGSNHQLKSLSLIDPSFQNTSFTYLFSALKDQPGLHSCQIRGHLFEKEEENFFLDVIQHMNALQFVDLRWSTLSDNLKFKLINLWDVHSTLKHIEWDNAQEDIHGALWQKIYIKKNGYSSPVYQSNIISQSSDVFQITINNQTEYRREIPIRGDGDCGYSAMGTTRAAAADLFWENRHDEHLQEILGSEIEDHFEILPSSLKSNLYQQIKQKQIQLDRDLQDKIRRANDILRRPDGDRWSSVQLINAYFQGQVSLVAHPVMQALMDNIFLEEQNIREKKLFCRSPETIKNYITHVIRISPMDYGDLYGMDNWITYVPSHENHLDRLGTASAVAYVLRKNLIIWTPEGFSYGYNPYQEGETLHLMHRDGNHFNRLSTF